MARPTPPHRAPVASREELPTHAVADARHSAGLSKRELAERIGVPLWTVDRIERGDQNPEPHLGAIAAATGLPAERLRGATSAPSTELGPSTQERLSSEDADPAPADASEETPQSHWVRNVIFGSVVALVTIRFFAEDLAILPGTVKYVDIPILLVLVLLSWIAPRSRQTTAAGARYLLPAVAFLAICVASLLLNSARAEVAPALFFVYGFLAPIGIFHVVRTLWPTGQALAFSKLLVVLICVQFAAVLGIDIPEYIADPNPDFISGTFGENPYQLVFFLLVASALLAGIVTYEGGRRIARYAPLLFAAAAGTILLAQYRAILMTTVLTVLLIAVLLGFVRVRGALAGVLVAVVFAVGIAVIPPMFPELKFQETIDTLTGDPGSYVSLRLQAGGDVVAFYNDEPESILFGAGPGTFNSRAWEIFYSPTEAGGIVALFPFMAPSQLPDVAEKYTGPRLAAQESVQGSFALVTPYSSYYALLAEVGLIGFILFVSIYGLALRDSVRMTLTAMRRAPDGDPLPGLLLASSAGFFVLIQMAILENWWEVTRVTFILWILFAIATKEFEARYGPASAAKAGSP